MNISNLFKTFVTEPYSEAVKSLKSAWRNDPINQKVSSIESRTVKENSNSNNSKPLGLMGRVTAFCKGVVLLTPVLNAIVLKISSYVNTKFFCKPSKSNDNVGPVTLAQSSRVVNDRESGAILGLNTLITKFNSLQIPEEIKSCLFEIHEFCCQLDPSNRNYVGDPSNKPSKNFKQEMMKKFNLDEEKFNNLNRYGNITSARVESNVILPSGKYINASDIKSVGVIATQGPQKNTLGDYFEMVFDNGGPAISVSNSQEKEKEKYFGYDANEGRMVPGGFSVGSMEFQKQSGTIHHTESIPIKFENIIIGYKNVFEFRDGENKLLRYPKGHKWVDQEMRVEQFHYTKWPDKSLPEDSRHVVHVLNQVIEAQKWNSYKNGAKVVVHCSAGVGRTGTTIAILDAMVKLNKKETPTSAVGAMLDQREYRVNMVQTPQQLIMIYEVTKDLKAGSSQK